MPLTGAVLVTGGAQRIGRAIALDLASAGFNVAIQYQSSQTEADEVAAEIRRLGRRAAILKADFIDRTAPPGLIKAAIEAVGPLSALVTCASAFEDDELSSLTLAGWDRHMRTNLEAPIRLTAEFAAARNGQKGAIVHLIDQRVLKPTPQFFSYTLSKLALWQSLKTMAQALAPNIRVNGIAPGPTLRNRRQAEGDFAKQQEATLLKNGSPPEEIVKAVRYLLEAEAVTGHMITVDGGQHLIWQTPDVVGLSE